MSQHPRKGDMTSRRRKVLVPELLERDGPLCWICECYMSADLPEGHPERISIDHVNEFRTVQHLHGQRNHPDNLRLAHAICNSVRDRNRRVQGWAPAPANEAQDLRRRIAMERRRGRRLPIAA